MSFFTIKQKENRLQSFWSVGSNRPINYPDIVFKCVDGSVAAHKALLVLCCPQLSKILDQDQLQHTDKSTVVLPDFSIHSVKLFLQLVYTGSIKLKEKSEFEDMKQLVCDQLGFYFPVFWSDIKPAHSAPIEEVTGKNNNNKSSIYSCNIIKSNNRNHINNINVSTSKNKQTESTKTIQASNQNILPKVPFDKNRIITRQNAHSIENEIQVISESKKACRSKLIKKICPVKIQSQNYYCPACKVILFSDITWKAHIKKNHSNGTIVNNGKQLDIIKEMKKNKDKYLEDETAYRNMVQELLQMTVLGGSSVMCTICYSIFQMKYKAIEHLELAHLNIKKYPCQFCDEIFDAESTYCAHKFRVHLEETKEKCQETSGLIETVDISE